MNNNIVYNGAALDSAAPVRVEDIRVGAVRLSPVVRPRAIAFGSDFVRMGGGERTITITFAIQTRDMIERQASIAAVCAWAKTDAEYKLELPQRPEMYLQCVCTSKPEPSARQWWENKLRLVFTCYDNPFWTSKAEKAVSCGTQMTVLGDAPPLMRIERALNASASNQSYSDGTNTMTFSQIGSGNLVIDVNRQTAAVGTTSIMQYYQPSSKFIQAKTGTYTITGTGTVKFRERWL